MTFPAAKPRIIDPTRPLCDDAHTQTIPTGGLMADTIIENPILNSPFREPDRHWRFTDEGITNEIVETRRASCLLRPDPSAQEEGQATPV